MLPPVHWSMFSVRAVPGEPSGLDAIVKAEVKVMSGHKCLSNVCGRLFAHDLQAFD